MVKSYDLFVEGPQLFQRPAPARHDDDICLAVSVQGIQRGGHLLGSAVSLHQRRRHDHASQRTAQAQRAQDVAQGGGRGGGDDADDGGAGRQHTLTLGGEQPLGFQPRLQLFEAQMQLADASRLHSIHIELICAALLEDTEAAVGDDGHAVTQRRHVAAAAAEQHAAQGGAFVLEGKVAVAGGRLRAAHPHILEVVIFFQQVLEIAGDLADGDDAHRVRSLSDADQ